jgi:hypothetical protein
MESWRNVWRRGLAPLLSVAALEALRQALAGDDSRLVQGVVTVPPPLGDDLSLPVEAACAIGLCGWLGEGLTTVEEVEGFFVRTAFEIDRRMGEPAASRWFIGWYDEAGRKEMRQLLLAEVELALAGHRGEDAGESAA